MVSPPPRLRGVPGLGSLIPFARDPLAFVAEAARLGDVVWYRLVDHQLVQLSHPALVEAVLVDHAKDVHKDAIYDLLRPSLGDGLVTSEGETWRRHRKLAAPSFQKRHVDGYAEAFVACTEDWLGALPDQVDLHEQFMALTQRIVLDTLFGTDLGVDTSGVAHALHTVMAGFSSESQGPGRLLPRWVPTRTRRRVQQAIADLDRTIYAIIESRRRIGLGDDLLSRLVAARDEQGGFDDRALRDEAVTAFVAGHETTALALTYAIVLLGERPEAWAPVVAEVDRVLGDRAATAGDFAALPRTTDVIREAMRVLPPVWAVGREAQRDLVIGGHEVPVGTQIVMSQWVMHRDPRWFDDPLAFRPERWAGDLQQRLPRMAYLPFGGGPRVCIGNHFALLEAVLVLATLARRIRPVPTGPRPRLVPSITMRPGGPVPARIERR
ncbi:MAG: cytochrome P450 [Myxococcota bacterium]